MKKALLGVALVFGLVGCSAERAEVREEGTETRARLEDDRLRYQRDMEARLDRIDEQIEEQRAQMRERRLNAQAQREWNERMSELERARAETREKYNELKNATAEGWNDLKQGVDDAADSLERSWNEFVADART
jgi:hypothetical protein